MNFAERILQHAFSTPALACRTCWSYGYCQSYNCRPVQHEGNWFCSSHIPTRNDPANVAIANQSIKFKQNSWSGYVLPYMGTVPEVFEFGRLWKWHPLRMTRQCHARTDSNRWIHFWHPRIFGNLWRLRYGDARRTYTSMNQSEASIIRHSFRLKIEACHEPKFYRYTNYPRYLTPYKIDFLVWSGTSCDVWTLAVARTQVSCNACCSCFPMKGTGKGNSNSCLYKIQQFGKIECSLTATNACHSNGGPKITNIGRYLIDAAIVAFDRIESTDSIRQHSCGHFMVRMLVLRRLYMRQMNHYKLYHWTI